MRFCDIYAGILVGGVRGMFENCNLWKRGVCVKFLKRELLEYLVHSVKDHIEQQNLNTLCLQQTWD